MYAVLTEHKPKESVGAGTLTPRGKVLGADAFHCEDTKSERLDCTCWPGAWHPQKATEAAGPI